MADLDLTAAIQAGADALDEALGRANISTSSTTLAEAAVRAAAALIERAALERAAAEAEKCLRCGKPHEYRQVDAYRHSWAERDVIEAAKAYAHAWDVYANPSRHPGIAEAQP
jgi:hypothetical protein